MPGFLTVNGQPVPVETVEDGPCGGEPQGKRNRIKIGQRFHRAGYTGVVWQAISVYRDSLGCGLN